MNAKAWSEGEELELIDMYANETKDVNKIAAYFGRGHRSIISKLVQLGIYEKPDNKNKGKILTVKSMIRELEDMLEIEIDSVNLNKKQNLYNLLIAVRKLYERSN